jgi:hypothetical protein
MGGRCLHLEVYNTESYLAQTDCLAADRQGQGDTRLTPVPSVIPKSNYVIMVSDWIKFFCVFCTVFIRSTETFWSLCINEYNEDLRVVWQQWRWRTRVKETHYVITNTALFRKVKPCILVQILYNFKYICWNRKCSIYENRTVRPIKRKRGQILISWKINFEKFLFYLIVKSLCFK